MPPHGVGAPGVVDGDVVDGVVVGGPGGACADADDLVVVQCAGAQVLEPQRVSLVALDVHRVGQDVAVEADGGGAEREEVVPFGLDVLVEQDLLAGDLGLLVELWRRPVLGIADRATALHAVLLALEASAVVPPVVTAGWHGQIGFLGARLYLVEDLLPQRRQVLRGLFRVVVLGLQIVDDFGVRLVAQPLVGVDEHVAMVFPTVSTRLASGGFTASIQSLNLQA